MEEQLRRAAVVVTFTGTCPVLGPADVAKALHAEFRVGPDELSVRAFAPEDFLVLCGDPRLRDRMVAKGCASSP
jgi:hypothetical protein